IDYSVQIIEQIVEQIDLNETDIFKRIENIGLKKLRIQRKFPQVFDFLVSTKQEESAEVKEIIKQKVDPIYDESTNKMYEQIDYSVQINEQIVEQIDLNETDIFKRIENIGLKKLRIQRKFPQVFDFLVSTKQEESAEVKEIIKQKVDPIYDESTNKMYEQIDY